MEALNLSNGDYPLTIKKNVRILNIERGVWKNESMFVLYYKKQ